MAKGLEDAIALVSAEQEHACAFRDSMLYLLALAETRRDGAASNLFVALPPDLAVECDDAAAQRIQDVVTAFIEGCPTHADLSTAFRVLETLRLSDGLERYFLDKLERHCAWGDAHLVYQLCILLENLGVEVFRDANGLRVCSVGVSEPGVSLGYARRLLARKRDARTLDAADITHQCVLVCDLGDYHGTGSVCWTAYRGSQDEVGAAIAQKLAAAGVVRLEDFGGVAQSLLCEGEAYLDEPPRVKPGGAIFSFTPKRRMLAEGHAMARVAAAAGYRLMILTLQKYDKYGKSWVLGGVLRHAQGGPYTFYEDTADVVDEIKAAAEGSRVVAVHVQSAGFEAFRSERADRVISPSQYRQEVVLA
jgi:hypothetical protein